MDKVIKQNEKRNKETTGTKEKVITNKGTNVGKEERSKY